MKAALKEADSVELFDTVADDAWVRNTDDLAHSTVSPGMRVPVGQAENKGYTWQDVGGTLLDWRGTADIKPEELQGIASGTIAGRFLEGKTTGVGPLNLASKAAGVMLNPSQRQAAL